MNVGAEVRVPEVDVSSPRNLGKVLLENEIVCCQPDIARRTYE